VLEGGDGLPMFRMGVPVIALFAVLVAAALQTVVAAAQRLGATRRRFAVFAIAAAAFALLLVLARPPQTLAQYAQYRDQHDIEIPRWLEVGAWLAQHTPEDASVAVVPIGAIGYASKRPIVDMVGLTDRHIAHRPAKPAAGWAGHEKTDGRYVLSREPAVLLLGNVDVRARPLPLDDPSFARPDNPAIRAREDDIFTPALLARYEPRIARLPSGGHLHYFARRAR
jgi:hypothetical protein